MLWYCFVRVLSMPAAAPTATSTMRRMSNFRRQRTATESKKVGVAAEPVAAPGTSSFYRVQFEICMSRYRMPARRLSNATDAECRPPGSTRTDWTSWPSSCRGGGLGGRRGSADRSREQFRGSCCAAGFGAPSRHRRGGKVNSRHAHRPGRVVDCPRPDSAPHSERELGEPSRTTPFFWSARRRWGRCSSSRLAGERFAEEHRWRLRCSCSRCSPWSRLSIRCRAAS